MCTSLASTAVRKGGHIWWRVCLRGLRVPLRINSGAVDRSWFAGGRPAAQSAAQTNCSRPVCLCRSRGWHCERMFPGDQINELPTALTTVAGILSN
ncbi:hypothetical protein GWI33_001421 [Rhynchophorus ferrugineus]|uniref:Uncharacterized protein n=1 Tax=Rhynchophorus ferrugineus TaxID=354439 RepID=A0A834IY11_RHYFE|nr:hypothetical protein GWI33_001421 [Rhynchophorus ferrugineus]